MRQPTDKCLICNERNATKQNSHIIPKFFGKGIFFGTKPRYGLVLTKKVNTNKIQDIIKENYLFCPECEKGISVLETYCALRLDRFNDLRYYNSFNIFKRKEFEFFECKNIDKKIFNLFIYSIIWRVSISCHYLYSKFKLIESDEEKLRILLKIYLETTQEKLANKLVDLKELPSHSHVIIRPRKRLRPPSSMLSAASLNDSIHQLHLVDYLIIYITNPTKLVEVLKEIDNNNLENLVRVGLTDPKLWEKFNFDLINKILK